MNEKEDMITLPKLIAIVFAVALIVTLALFSMGMATMRTFWIMIIAAAVVGYFILPSMNRNR